MVLETTRDKVKRLFTPETQAKIEKAGLMVVDKADFEMVMNGYFEAQSLRTQLKKREPKGAVPDDRNGNEG